ncbi:acetylxylan esterase [Novipirellula artificiosorum]|nr:acetylxylan esterase [Novipirellula artificiosorum]
MYRILVVLLIFGVVSSITGATAQDVFSPDQIPQDVRLGELRNLNGYFPMQVVERAEQWRERRDRIRRRILVSQGLWPMPTRSDLNAVVHGRVDRDGYVVDRVFFESVPGHFVTGSLYRPKHRNGPCPAILSPHGHWEQGRMYDAGEEEVAKQIESGAEAFAIGGRHPIQARAVQLARMGCIVFCYDMTGVADSVQIAHRPDRWRHLDRPDDWGFMSVQADLRLQNMMGLQTWNSIRCIDFLLSLDDVDPARIGVTGASGGGTQSMIVAAIDNRITAAMPCVMVSTAMQGGCTCENAPLLRIDQGNVDIAAAIAPRPLGLTAADDWTVELETKGYPQLRHLYQMLGATNSLSAVFYTQFKHNYNQVNRHAMYEFFNRHFDLGFEKIEECDYVPLTLEEATVWNKTYPRPSGDQIGEVHEVELLKLATQDSDRRLRTLDPGSDDFHQIIGAGWETILGRRLDEVGEVTFEVTAETKRSGVKVQAGKLTHSEQGEQIPLLQLRPQSESIEGVVVWVGNAGKADLFDSERLNPLLAEFLDRGNMVLSADLFGQGEFLKYGLSEHAQRMWYQPSDHETGWRRFSGYTYGYNHSLFAQRTHDLLSMIRYAQGIVPANKITLIGLGRTAGPLAMAAASQSGDVVLGKVTVDVEGFRFESIRSHDDPMFVPGAVKYLDIEGLRFDSQHGD